MVGGRVWFRRLVYEVVKPGVKFNMTDMQAAIGLHQLPQLDAWIERRAEL